MIRAPVRNGISQKQFIPPFGLTATGSELTWANWPQPLQKKSPSGTSTAGAGSPSQKKRSTSRRQLT